MQEKKMSIIVADDEAVQRNVLSNIIQKICPSSEVIACSNGTEVYDILKVKSVDIVLTDIQMPIMDGMELIKKLSEEFPKTKIILISAYQKFEYAQNAIKCRVVDYLIKPFRVSDVQQIMEKVITEIEIENENENSINNYHYLAAEAKKQEEQRFLQDILLGKVNTIRPEQEEYKSFGAAYIITEGGPNNASLFYVFNLWRQAFKYMDMGKASAMAWILFIVVLLATLLVFKTSKKWVYNEGGVE